MLLHLDGICGFVFCEQLESGLSERIVVTVHTYLQ